MFHTQRPLNVASDLPQALAMADVSGLNIPHVADWPYRFSSWAVMDVKNTQVWLDATAQIVAWAVMQTPFWAIDCVVAQESSSALYRAVLSWAKSRATDLLACGEGRPIWFLAIDAARGQQCRELEEQEFENISHHGGNSWSKVVLEHKDATRLEPVRLPEGFQMRTLNPTTEVQKYVDLHRDVFKSESMTSGWRAQVTQAKDYDNALDLVIASENGDLQGFCIGWLRQLATGERVGQVEPLGVRDGYRGKKFSRQLLTEMIRRMHARGATRIVIETDQHRTPALAAYKALGFKVAHDVLVYKYIVAVR